MKKTKNKNSSIDPSKITKVILGQVPISMEEFVAVSRYNAEVVFSSEYKVKVNKSRQLVDMFMNENRLIYGVTTGFGDNVRTRISPEEAETLQLNILRSHAVSVGKTLPEEVIRATQLMILIHMGQGYSGVSLEVVSLIKDMLNKKVIPFAPGDGSVGYLSVEAHISLVLIGEGKAWYNGVLFNGQEALDKAGLKSVKLRSKEGLALLNGTTSVTAMAILTLHDAFNCTKLADVAGALTFESLKGTLLGLDNRLLSVKLHQEQLDTADNIKKILKDSENMQASIHLSVQDPCSIRCIPHIIGSVKRTLKEAWRTVFEEMNSCCDNPIIYPENDSGVALMGGNFDGSYLGIHMDSASIAMGTLAKWSERLADRLLNRHLNHFPPFLAKKPGLNNGFMILQYTAAALVDEIKVLSHPCSVDSIPTCANQEDYVSFAYLSSKKSYDILGKLEYILSIQILVCIESLDFLNDYRPSKLIQKIYKYVRDKIPSTDDDRYFYKDIETMKKMVHERELVNLVEKEIGSLKI